MVAEHLVEVFSLPDSKRRRPSILECFGDDLEIIDMQSGEALGQGLGGLQVTRGDAPLSGFVSLMVV